MSLIDKQDNFEIVRDKISLILANEIASQQILAEAADKNNPADWKLRIFMERTNPWELFSGADNSPIVNIWYDNSRFDGSSSDTVERQKSEAIYNLDCYGYGVSSESLDVGQNPGDKVAAFQVQKAVRLVRNILMSADYIYLDLRGLVWKRWPQSINIFQPQIDDRSAANIIAARIALSVEFSEFAPQITGENLEFISIDIKRSETGEILAEADYDYTT